MHLLGVHLLGVHLLGVHLLGVHLMGVYLMDVHLTGVYRVPYGCASYGPVCLMGVHLMGVHLMGVHLMSVHLRGVHFNGRGRSYLPLQVTCRSYLPRSIPGEEGQANPTSIGDQHRRDFEPAEAELRGDIEYNMLIYAGRGGGAKSESPSTRFSRLVQKSPNTFEVGNSQDPSKGLGSISVTVPTSDPTK
jgi:hypothetical protein